MDAHVIQVVRASTTDVEFPGIPIGSKPINVREFHIGRGEVTEDYLIIVVDGKVKTKIFLGP